LGQKDIPAATSKCIRYRCRVRLTPSKKFDIRLTDALESQKCGEQQNSDNSDPPALINPLQRQHIVLACFDPRGIRY
jgi:hypothetical protein